MLINVSGRGDKDMETAMKWFQLGEPTAETGDVTPGDPQPVDVNAGDITSGTPARRSPMTALPSMFADLEAEGRAALVGYLPAGYPTVDGSKELLAAMIDGGCDLVEVGLPFSDPVLDGPVIQHAAQTALAGGFRVRDVFGIVESVTAAGGRAVVMTYFNPVLAYGVDAFARDLAAAGGSGVITPDLIVDEAGPWLAAATASRARPDLPGRAVVVGRTDRADRRRHQRVPLRRLHHGRHRCAQPGVRGRAGAGRPLPGDHRPAARRRARGPDRRAGRARSPGSPTR